LEIGRNLVHGSDSVEAAEREIALFFNDKEIVTWRRDVEPWLFE
jgi:nucleoside-diphosphate kinase